MSKQQSLVFVKNIPPELKREFKAVCAQQGKTMSEVIKDFMAEVIRLGKGERAVK